MPTPRKTDQQWIAQFHKVGHPYAYRTPSFLVKTNRYFTAVCRLHGDFDVPAGQHAQGYSKCPDCMGKARITQPKPAKLDGRPQNP